MMATYPLPIQCLTFDLGTKLQYLSRLLTGYVVQLVRPAPTLGSQVQIPP